MRHIAPLRLAVVSYMALHEYTPRGVRTRNLVKSLSAVHEVELVSGPLPASTDSVSLPRRALRFARYKGRLATMLDPYEPWARRRLGRWRPSADLALLIGYPWSPVSVAAARCRSFGIPYVVDASDPWVLTAGSSAPRGLGAARAARAEARLWGGAAGAILTTEAQRKGILTLAPSLPTLVRPNAYSDVDEARTDYVVERAGHGELHVGHFGNLYAPRIDLARFLSRFATSGRWSKVVLHQLGDDWNGTLRRLPEAVEVRVSRPRPWGEVRAIARQLDAAIVLGNTNPAQLPSKTIDYLTLPARRVALTRDRVEDATARYVDGRAGWTVICSDDDDAADRLASFLEAPLAPGALDPPEAEGWSAVGAEVRGFLEQLTRPRTG